MKSTTLQQFTQLRNQTYSSISRFARTTNIIHIHILKHSFYHLFNDLRQIISSCCSKRERCTARWGFRSRYVRLHPKINRGSSSTSLFGNHRNLRTFWSHVGHKHLREDCFNISNHCNRRFPETKKNCQQFRLSLGQSIIYHLKIYH